MCLGAPARFPLRAHSWVGPSVSPEREKRLAMFEGLFRGEHLLIILLIVIMVFPNKIGGLGASLGKTIRDFKKAMSEPEHPESTHAAAKPPSGEQHS